jgi:hypothetical protein
MLQINQTADPLVGQVLDIVALILLLVYVYYYAEYRREDQQQLRRNARQRATASLLGFALFTVLVSAFGPDNTFVAPIGSHVMQYFESFAQSIVITGIGETTSADSSLGAKISSTLKLIGLISYIVIFGAISASNSIITSIIEHLKNLIGG